MKRVLLALLALALPLAACGRDAPTAFDSHMLPKFATDDGPSAGAEGLFVPGWSERRCFDPPGHGKQDPDGDTMDNGCEDALAAAFAPGLRVAVDCNYDPDVGRQGGEYYYGVQPYQDGSHEVVRIAYLPAYYWDCGSPAEKDLPFNGSHDGDSEFFIVDVQFDATTRRWVTQHIFLSAHCGTVTGQYCIWYPDPTAPTPVLPAVTAHPFSWVDGTVRGAPIIWVAEGKHSNYSSADDCDSGGLAGSDSCEHNDRFYRFPVRFAQQNIWSRAVPHEPCVGASLWGSTRVAPGTTECFWPRRTFYGWQGLNRTGSTAYSDLLAQYAGW
jgi:hypothetical protein